MNNQVKRYFTTLAFDRPELVGSSSHIQGMPVSVTSYELTAVVLASDYDALLAERDKIKVDRKACWEEFKRFRRTTDETERELRAEVEALKKDAERYRWIISKGESGYSEAIQTMWAECKTRYPTPDEWNAAIDAAMQGEQP